MVRHPWRVIALWIIAAVAVVATAPTGTYALAGGTTVIFADIQAAMNHDYAIVFPVAAVIILPILMLLLRSLVAPWYLASVGRRHRGGRRAGRVVVPVSEEPGQPQLWGSVVIKNFLKVAI